MADLPRTPGRFGSGQAAVFSGISNFKYLAEPSLQLNGLTYPDLVKQHNRIAIRFDSYVLPIVCVETDDMDLIEDMFSRLNEAVPLNAAEKRNALGGPMVRIITKVSNHEFFRHKVSFSNRRYQYREVAARLLYIEYCIQEYERIYDTKKPYLDNMVKTYKYNKLLNPQPLCDKVELVLETMSSIFSINDTLLRSQSNIPVYYLLVRTAVAQQKLGSINRGNLLAFREDVEQNRITAQQDISKANFEWLEFDRMSVQGTNDAVSISERTSIIGKYLKIEIPNFHKSPDEIDLKSVP